MFGRRGVKSAIMFFVFLMCISFALASPGFQTNSVLLKVSVSAGDSSSKPVSIFSEKGGEFNLELIGNLNGISLSESSFVLNINETKNIIVSFNSSGIKEGVYAGSIRITSKNEVSYLPIIFEVESRDVFYDVSLSVSPSYTVVAPGANIVADVTILDLISGGTTDGLGTVQVKLDYHLYNAIDGSVLSSESESIAVQGKTRITKTLNLPANVKEGDYVLAASSEYKSSVGTSAAIFRVEKPAAFGNFDIKTFLIFGLLVVFILVIAIFFMFFLREKDRMLIELERYNKFELKNQKEILLSQAKLIRQSGKVSATEVSRKVKEKIVALKHKQKKREKTLKKLKQEGKTSEMKEKLNEWKSEGYNLGGLGYEMKGASTKQMKEMLEKWKKQYGK